MREVRALLRAPGKAVVLGEYAVLDGAPALVAAIDIGVTCTITPAPSVCTSSVVGDTRFVDAALAQAGAPPAHYAFGLWRPPSIPGKPGLGGSAAATVVAVAASLDLDAPWDREAIRRVATRVHRAVQGSGSGIDVAASCHGGLLRFAGHEHPPRAVQPPPGELRLIWSGTSAQTGPRVERYRAWRTRRAFVDAMTQTLSAFSTEPVRAMREQWSLLTAMAADADLPYRTPALDRIVALAQEAHGAAKPSGAGGGDIAIAWLPDPELASVFDDRCEAEGFPILRASIDPHGVHRLDPDLLPLP